jgi:hypothetical protein
LPQRIVGITLRGLGRAILAQLRNGTMPFDGRWAPEHVAIFERWIAGGSLP